MRDEHTRTAYPAGVLFGLSVSLSLYVSSAASSLGWEGAGMLGVAMGAVHAMASVARGGAPRFMSAIISGLWITALALGVTGHPDNPARALIELLIVASGLSWLWSWSSSTWPQQVNQRTRSARHGASVGLMLSWGGMMALPSSHQELPEWVDEFTRHGERAWWVALKPTRVMPGPTSAATAATTQEEPEDEVV